MKELLGVILICMLSEFIETFRPVYYHRFRPRVWRLNYGRMRPRISRNQQWRIPETSQTCYREQDENCKYCGTVNRIKKIRMAIIKGEEVEPPYKYPWMVQIYTEGNKTCTGAIISEYYILTAAHCLVKDNEKHPAFTPSKAKLEFFNPEDIRVAFVTSTHNTTFGPRVEEVVPHPWFTMSKMSYDIGLLKLQKRIICNKFRQRICLPPRDLSLPKDAIETISGWGSTTGRVKDINYVLQEAKVKEESFDECRGPSYLKGKYYCFKGLRNSALCYGDSGGPAFYEHDKKNYVIGVASFGECRSKRPFYYTSVPAHLDWIYQNVE